MWIDKLSLYNFRNYKSQEIKFNEDINIFIGDNAQGKTNLLESIYYLANASSFKKISDSDLIRFNQENMKLSALVRKGRSLKKVLIQTNLKDKSIFVNEVKYDKRYLYRSLFKVVLFTPEDLQIIKEGPALRRELIDQIIKEVDPSYQKIKKSYDKILYQRNMLLKRSNTSFFNESLKAYDISLAKYGTMIYKRRKKIIKILEGFANNFHKNLTMGKEELSLSYEPDISAENNEDFLEILKKSRTDDLKKSSSQKGPHRDEIKIIINGRDSRKFASQGQQRSAILNIKLAQVRLIKEVSADKALILFDDVFSELDEKRSLFLLENLKGYQTIITATNTKSLEYIDEEKIKYIYNGSIRKE